MPKVVNLKSKPNISGNPNIIVEVQSVNPEIAAQWLKANNLNRPVRKRHVTFLANEMSKNNWQLNGQAIIVSVDEEILDGQHRLLAVIESGCTIETLVIYGIEREAFKTIDTGIVRSAPDALALWYPDAPRGLVAAVGSSVNYCKRIELGFSGSRKKTSNTDAIAYVTKHKTMWRCGEILSGYPRDARPLALSATIACYEIFHRKNQEAADNFMRRFYTGEGLHVKDAEYVLRMAFIKDAQRLTSYPIDIKLKMVVKAWNMVRRGRGDEVTRNSISVQPSEPDKLMAL